MLLISHESNILILSKQQEETVFNTLIIYTQLMAVFPLLC